MTIPELFPETKVPASPPPTDRESHGSQNAQNAITGDINLFRQLHADGYQVVPIIPGKKWPGQRQVAGRWENMTGWSEYQATEADLDRWHADGAGVGVVAGPDTVWLDIDIADEALADRAERSATEWFGLAPCRVGQWPRRALVFRVDQAFNKTTSGDPSQGLGIEYRTGPHQTVAFGTHPTGRQYEWPRPLVAKRDLPLVKTAKLRAFKAEWDAILGSSGKVIETEAADRSAVPQESLKGPFELVAAAVRAIPNDARPAFNRDWWIAACHAIAAASADYPHEGFDLWLTLCERHPSHDEAKAIHAWDTIGTEHQIGVDWLCQEALQYSDAFAQVLVDQKKWYDADAIEHDDGQIEPQDPFGFGDTSSVVDVPPGVFPEAIDKFARDESRRTGMPMAFVALSALVTVAGAVGNKVRIQPKANDTGWTLAAILWGLLAGGVGSMKTPAMNAAIAALAKVDEARSIRGNQLYADWEKQKKLAKTAEAKAALPPPPKVARNLVVDSTTEALGAVLADNPSGVLIHQDELMALIGSLDAYKSSKGGDRAKYLQLNNGGYMPIDRIGRRISVPFWGASIIGGIQPDKLRQIADDLGDDGMLQRFLVVYIEDRFDLGDDQDVDEAPDLAAAAAYNAIVTKWATAPSDIPSMIVRLSDEAQEVWRPLAGRIRVLAQLPGLSGAWRGHIAKWPGISARLLLLCHLLNNPDVETHEIDGLRVSPATARQAVKLAEWFLANSLRFYSECVGGGEAVDDARWIAGHILTKPGKERFSRNDIGDARHQLRGQDDRILRAMSLLSYMGWVIPNNSDRLDNRRRPTQWTICPAVHDGRFASYAEIERKERSAKQAAIRAAGLVRAEIMGAENVFG